MWRERSPETFILIVQLQKFFISIKMMKSLNFKTFFHEHLNFLNNPTMPSASLGQGTTDNKSVPIQSMGYTYTLTVNFIPNSNVE